MSADTDVVNQAIMYMGGNQLPVTGSAPGFDNSASGKAAQLLYTPCVKTVARQFGWDFSRKTVTLVETGNTPPQPWAKEYLYPSNGIQIRQLLPASLSDPMDPLPITWDVANNVVSAVTVRVILTNQANALAVYTNQPGPDLWDPLFRESVVRLLASEMAEALAGRPETARSNLESGAAFEQIGEDRDS